MVRTTRHCLAALTAVVLLAPLAMLYAADPPVPKVDPLAQVGATDSVPAVPTGSSDLNPVDDVLLARRGKAAWHGAFSRGEVFKRTDLEKAMNRREPLNLAVAPTAKGVLSDEEFPRRVHAATLALFTISETRHKAGEGAALETAFLVQEGVAVTCFHAFKNLGDTFAVVGLTAAGTPVKVTKILAVYPLEDLAFVQVEGAGKEFLSLRANAPAGSRVRAVGHPLNHYFFTIEGTIGRYASKKRAGADKPLRMNLVIGGIDGFSGAALVDAAGNAVGMLDSYATLSARDSKYQMQSAIPAATILEHFTQPYVSSQPLAAARMRVARRGSRFA